MAGSHQKGPVGGALRWPGGSGAEEEGAGRLAGQDGDLEGQDGPCLLPDSRLSSEGAEGKFQNFVNPFFHREIFSVFSRRSSSVQNPNRRFQQPHSG